jgi:ATP-binding cassette subfamily F protein 3
MIKQTEKFIERFRAKASKSNQVQSRVKALERMEKVNEVIDDNISVNFRFKFSRPSGREVVSLEEVTKAYGENVILRTTTARIERGDKIALIGANGKGKSTLLRVIDGTEPVTGKREFGHNVIKAFFAQHQLEALNVENEVIQEMLQAGSDKSEMELRSVLGCFLFSGDDVFKKIKVLSGGEKSRVALAKTLISEANFLLLDEPTNHLDIQSVNILIQALQQYEGTFITVSHDRQFLKGIANKIWYIEDREIREYPGTYEEYALWKSQQEVKPSDTKAQKKEMPTPIKSAENDSQSQQLRKDLKKKEKDLMDLDEKIMQLEEDKLKLETQMADPVLYDDEEKLAEINTAYTLLQKRIDSLNREWELIAEEIENLQGILS